MDDEILNQIKTNILNATSLTELQSYLSQMQKRIDFLSQIKLKPPVVSNLFNNHFC